MNFATQYGNVHIGFLQYTPAGYDPNGAELHPLIIFLHGKGNVGDGSDTQLESLFNSSVGGMGVKNTIPWYCADATRGNSFSFNVGGQTSSFVVLSPQLDPSFVNAAWPGYYVTAMLKWADDNLMKIDPKRIYVTGLSLGGAGTWRAILEDDATAARIAAIAPVAANNGIDNQSVFNNKVSSIHLPIWAFAELNDDVVSVYPTRNAQDFCNNAQPTLAPPAKFTYYADNSTTGYYADENGTDYHRKTWDNAYQPGHITTAVEGGGSFTAYTNLYEWLLQHTLHGPAANAGSAQNITTPVTSFTLTGSGSNPYGGSISSYSWIQKLGPSTTTITNANTQTATVSGFTNGTYVFTLTVTDNAGIRGSADVVVTLNNQGNSQVPSCVSNNTPANGSTISTQTTATLTWPSSADATSYDVYLQAGTATPTALVTNTSSLTYSASGLTANTSYSWYIAPRNASGAATTCSTNNKTTFTTAAASQTLTSNAGNNATITLPTSSVTLDGSASTGNIVQYYWYQSQGPVQSVIGNNFLSSTTATGLTTAGTYVFGLQVKDNTGALSYSYKTVTVNPAATGSVPACVTNTSPTNGSTITTPTTATLTWPASATATSYDVYLQAGSGTPTTLVTNTNALTYSANGLAANTTYSWYIAPRNASGTANTCSGNKTTFTTAAANQTLTSNAGTNTTITLPTSTVTLDGSASTGNIVQYYWYQTQGPVQSVISNNFSTTTTATGLTTAGSYVFGLQVKDNNGALAYSYKTVTVNPPVPSCVTNTSPANGTVLATQTTATLTWPSSATAASYDVYLQAGTNIPSTLVTNTSSLNYSVNGLTSNTTYSWYIAPRNASGAATTCGTANKTTFTTSAATQTLASNAGSNATITLPTSSVTLDGSASTGNIVQYYWYQTQGPTQSVIGNNFSTVTTATGLTTAGTYVFGLQVKDNSGTPAYSTKTVVVNAAGTRVAGVTTLQLDTTARTTAQTATPDLSTMPVLSANVSSNPIRHGQFAKLKITSNKAGTVAFRLVNAVGYHLATQKLILVPGINTTQVSTSGLSEGLYIIHITGGSKPLNLKLVVQ